MAAPGLWTPAEATKRIWSCARGEKLDLHWKEHALERLAERDLIVSDILFLLKYGTVFDEGQPADMPGFFKYKIESKTPNSEGRVVAAIVLPSGGCDIKIITVMWKDE